VWSLKIKNGRKTQKTAKRGTSLFVFGVFLPFLIFKFLTASARTPPKIKFLKPSTHIDENRELTIGVSKRQMRG